MTPGKLGTYTAFFITTRELYVRTREDRQSKIKADQRTVA
jgi:hypothetical protein